MRIGVLNLLHIFSSFIAIFIYLREIDPPSGVLPAPAPAAHYSWPLQTETSANGTATDGNTGVLMQSEAYYLPFELACLSRHPKFIIIALDSLQVLFVITRARILML